MSRFRAVAAVTAWMVLVIGASTLVWAVISRAGSDVVASQQPVAPASGTTWGQPSGGSSRATSSASTSPSPRGSTQAPSPGSSAPPRPSSGPTTGPSGGSTTPSSPGPTTQRRTWQGLGGAVVAQCERAAISVVSAAPANGFRAEVKNGGPEELEVEFEGREDESGRGATVTARCVAGAPDFRAQVEDD